MNCETVGNRIPVKRDKYGKIDLKWEYEQNIKRARIHTKRYDEMAKTSLEKLNRITNLSRNQSIIKGFRPLNRKKYF